MSNFDLSESEKNKRRHRAIGLVVGAIIVGVLVHFELYSLAAGYGFLALGSMELGY